MKLLSPNPKAVIVVGQLLGTSLWFSPNSAVESLSYAWNLTTAQFGQLTSCTQFGFIIGTLVLAVTGLADRFSASRIFAIASVLGALFNGVFALGASDLGDAMVVRFLVGLCLAGIYPLGMKMIIGWTRGNAGSALGQLVAMLTLGSALPHLVRAAGGGLPWQLVVLTSSALAVLGGLAVLALGDGPFLPPRRVGRLSWGASIGAFRSRSFRAAACGYFGHMWELYAFWTLVPFFVADALKGSDVERGVSGYVPAVAFMVIAVGAFGCLLAGRLSNRFGSQSVAATALAVSGIMCIVYPLIRPYGAVVSLIALLVWGIAVIADSAQFSAASAQACPPELVGGALAIQNSFGFAITIVSIMLVTSSFPSQGIYVAWYLAPGPLVGLLFLLPSLRAAKGQPSSSTA
ncbi:MFS transporter (plasmid) [Cupriavidus sp. P-10]|uniref:MFS transporter n=1 Tax=Cupriavidus sp. P-10 TaxID=2027911 RepID=UPI000E2F83DE|nr:MFS transporter [Cupriavidus sp. P-10]BDB29565.1 MFS transporter [Cupriavidus sp. P-10]